MSWQVTVWFESGGVMTFGVQAGSEQEAREVTGQRVTGLPVREIDVAAL